MRTSIAKRLAAMTSVTESKASTGDHCDSVSCGGALPAFSEATRIHAATHRLSIHRQRVKGQRTCTRLSASQASLSMKVRSLALPCPRCPPWDLAVDCGGLVKLRVLPRRVRPCPWALHFHSAPAFYSSPSIRFQGGTHRLFHRQTRERLPRLSIARPPRLRAWRRCAHPRCRARGVPPWCGSAAFGLR